MQPALQLASRILAARHPYWLTILDLYTRRPVPTWQDTRSDDEKSGSVEDRNAMWPGPYDLNNMHKPNVDLYRMGFDWVGVTSDLLAHCLRFCLTSAVAPGEEEGNSSYGCTHIEDMNSPNFRINISVAAELIWPLLSGTFTRTEKANVSLNLAATILHELAVCPTPPKLPSLLCSPAANALPLSTPPSLPTT